MPFNKNLNLSSWNIFSEEEQSFLSVIFEKHPIIATNFERYLSIPTDIRLDIAFEDLEKTPRTGWVMRKIPNPENIKLHMEYVKLYAFEQAPTGVSPSKAQAIASIHDIPESIITDFIPTDPISNKDKATLEILAIKVIYQHSPKISEVLNLIKEYQEQITPESHWMHDVDKLDALFVALQYEAKYPEQIGLFKEFANHAEPQLKTKTGRELFIDLVKKHEEYCSTYNNLFKTSISRSREAWISK